MAAQYLANPGTMEGRRLCGYCACPLSRHSIRQYKGVADGQHKTKIYCFGHDATYLILKEFTLKWRLVNGLD